MMNIKKINRNKPRKYSEGEISIAFNLIRLNQSTLIMSSWLSTHCSLNEIEQFIFNKIIHQAIENIHSWNEEELKMNFISYILGLSHIESTRTIRTFFERTIDAEVEGVYLKTKTDFMIAKGLLDVMQNPYFHFQEYKKDKDPNGDPLGQLLEAFLIAQVINKNDKPMYGAYIIGRLWYFVTMEGKEYCVSKAFDSTEEVGLIHIIAVLRHFKVILETVLIVD